MTSGAELVFRLPPSTTGELVFGDQDGLPPDVAVTVAATFPPPELQAVVAPRVDVQVNGAFAPMELQAVVTYDVDVARPLVCSAKTGSQAGQAVRVAICAADVGFDRLRLPATTSQQSAEQLRAPVSLQLPYRLTKARPAAVPRHTDADRLPVPASVQRHQEMLRHVRPPLSALHQVAIQLSSRLRTDHQDRYRDRRPMLASPGQAALPLSVRGAWPHASGLPINTRRGGRHQDAMRPQPGVTVIVPPVRELCYTPSPELVFSSPAAGSAALLFRCDRHDDGGGNGIIVPIRRVYMITNNVSLKRLGSSVDLAPLSLSLSVDVDSWTWGFSASLPGQALDAVSPDLDGSPAVLVATINGAAYRVLAEDVGMDRAFRRHAISVEGRGLSALLDDPYDPIATHGNSAERTAQQLMADVLSDNGSPMGWALDWQIADWLVPAGAWAMQGSRMAALRAIAGAAGGYIQPHPTGQTLRVLHRYPVAPWDWGTLSPDIVLPADVVQTEGVKWVRKPAYNRVFVSGQKVGVRAEVTRAGTAGDLAAPSVVDPLATAVAGAGQRGRAILSDTGRQAHVRLRLPVLAETGIIVPGKTVLYNDVGGVSRFGIVRSTAVEVGFPEVWQSIGVETHV